LAAYPGTMRSRPPLLIGWLAALLLLAAGPLARAQEGTEASDRAVEARLERVYAAVERLRGVEVEVDAGVAHLTGEVLRPEDREEAQRIAERVGGVLVVQNDVRELRAVRPRLEALGDELEDRLLALVAFLPLLGVGLGILFLAWLAARWVGGRESVFRRVTRNRFLQDIVRQAVWAVVLLLGLVAALEVMGATALVGAALGAAGVVGLAIGFAFRDLVENYIASVLLSLRQPFEPGDHVVVEGNEGKVLRLTSRATVLMTLDGNHLRIPNATVFKGVVLNYTRNPQRRFLFEVSVANETSLAAALELGARTLREMEGVVPDPGPFGRVAELADSTVLLRFFGWVDQRQHDFGKVHSEARRLVKGAFDREGVEMPEPGYRVLLTRAGPAEEPAAPAEPAATRDVDVDHGLDRRVAAERAETAERDLLDSSAPRE